MAVLILSACPQSASGRLEDAMRNGKNFRIAHMKFFWPAPVTPAERSFLKKLPVLGVRKTRYIDRSRGICCGATATLKVVEKSSYSRHGRCCRTPLPHLKVVHQMSPELGQKRVGGRDLFIETGLNQRVSHGAVRVGEADFDLLSTADGSYDRAVPRVIFSGLNCTRTTALPPTHAT